MARTKKTGRISTSVAKMMLGSRGVGGIVDKMQAGSKSAALAPRAPVVRVSAAAAATIATFSAGSGESEFGSHFRYRISQLMTTPDRKSVGDEQHSISKCLRRLTTGRYSTPKSLSRLSDKDFERARVEWLKLASENLCGPAQFALGRLYLTRLDERDTVVKADPVEALRLLTESGKNGCEEPHYYISLAYQDMGDPEKELQSLIEVINTDFIAESTKFDAAYRAGVLLYSGLGAVRDRLQAYKYFKLCQSICPEDVEVTSWVQTIEFVLK